MKSKAKKDADAKATFTEKFNVLRDYLLARAEAFRRVLPERGATVDRFVQTILYNVYRTPELVNCTRGSLFISAMGAAKLGLEPDQVLGHAYLIPFENKTAGTVEAQLIIGYRGMAFLAWRDAQILIRAAVVRERDEFFWQDGLMPRLRHVPSVDEDPGARIGAWAIATLPDGRRMPRWCVKREILEAKASSASSDNARSPWQAHPDPMWMKTPVRRMWPFLPVKPETGRALEAIESGQPIDEALEFTDATEGTNAEAGVEQSRGDADLAGATSALRDAKGLPTPTKQETVSDILEGGAREPEKIAVKSSRSEVRTPAEQQALDERKKAGVRFANLIMDLPSANWDEVFKRAGMKAPERITQEWLDQQSFGTLNNLSEIATKLFLDHRG